MPNFTHLPDGTAAFRTPRVRFLIAAESQPPPSAQSMRRSLAAHDAAAQLEILLSLRGLDATIETWIVRVLEQNDSPEPAIEAARLLSRGNTNRSLRALQRAFRGAHTAGVTPLAATCAASLWDRGEQAAAPALLSSQDTTSVADLRGIEKRIGARVPSSLWSEAALDRLRVDSNETSRHAAMRIRVCAGDARAIEACKRALRRPLAERLRAALMLTEISSRAQRAAIVRQWQSRETDPKILAALRGAAEPVDLVTGAMWLGSGRR